MITSDKIKHAVAGFGITFLVGFAMSSLAIGYCAGLLAGVGKEAYDWISNRIRAKKGLTPKHTVEASDVLFTLVGVAVGTGALLLFYVN
jgi:hypothetical protein